MMRKLISLLTLSLLITPFSSTRAELLFGPPTMLPTPPNSGYSDLNPSISSDGLELYFTSTRPPEWSSWVAHRASTSEPFGTPEYVTTLIHPRISSNGLSLFVNAAGQYGNEDIFVHTRPSIDAGWSVATNLGSGINTAQNERWCDISANGRELYFLRDWGVNDTYEIWVAQRPDPSQPFGEAIRLPGTINEGGHAGAPIISPDGLALVFTSMLPGGFGGFDFWVSMRPTTDSFAWGEPVNLGPEINTRLHESGGDFSADGRTFYFSRSSTTDLYGNFDLWQVDVIPEPTTLTLLGLGAATPLAFARSRRRRVS